MAVEDLRRVVVLSDCHFGEEGALLSRADVVEGLLTEMRQLGDIDRLVLLGDIWDLWRAGFPAAAGAGAVFFQALAAWGGPRETVLVVGNHDSHLWACFEEARRRREMGWRETDAGRGLARDRGAGERISPVISPVEGLELRVRYPLLSLEVGGKAVLCMHGHHLDFFSRSFWWAKTSWLARGVLRRSRGRALSDVDRLNRPFFELLTHTAHVPELRAWEYRFYGLLRFLARLLGFQSRSGGSPRRYTSVGENAGEAVDLLRDFLPGYIPDLFVFGHTHRAGLGRIRVGGRGVLMANTGCWLDGSGDETGMTYLVIDDEVRLRRLADWEVTATGAS